MLIKYHLLLSYMDVNKYNIIKNNIENKRLFRKKVALYFYVYFIETRYVLILVTKL